MGNLISNCLEDCGKFDVHYYSDDVFQPMPPKSCFLAFKKLAYQDSSPDSRSSDSYDSFEDDSIFLFFKNKEK